MRASSVGRRTGLWYVTWIVRVSISSVVPAVKKEVEPLAGLRYPGMFQALHHSGGAGVGSGGVGVCSGCAGAFFLAVPFFFFLVEPFLPFFAIRTLLSSLIRRSENWLEHPSESAFQDAPGWAAFDYWRRSFVASLRRLPNPRQTPRTPNRAPRDQRRLPPGRCHSVGRSVSCQPLGWD